jgi:hypothetical protein
LISNAKKDELIFSETIHAVKSAIEHIYYNLGFEEMVSCNVCTNENHMYYLSELYEKKINGMHSITCPRVPPTHPSNRPATIDSIAPDLTLPRVPTYKKNFKILEKLGN